MNEDKVILELIALRSDMDVVKEKVVRMDEVDKNIQSLMVSQDEILKIVRRGEQERLFANKRFDRLEQRTTVLEHKCG